MPAVLRSSQTIALCSGLPADTDAPQYLAARCFKDVSELCCRLAVLLALANPDLKELLACDSIPCQGGLTLIGDAQGHNTDAADFLLCVCYSPVYALQKRAPYLQRVMLHPAVQANGPISIVQDSTGQPKARRSILQRCTGGHWSLLERAMSAESYDWQVQYKGEVNVRHEPLFLTQALA